MTTMPVDWDDDVVRKYLTPEANQKSREEFYDTHIDVDKIHYSFLEGNHEDPEFVTQEEFKRTITNSSVGEDNRIFILRGETGSGKSQLCQWLEYEINDDSEDTHVALHVSRSETRPEDIIDIVTEPLDREVTVKNIDRLPADEVASAMVESLRAFAVMEQYEDEIRQLADESLKSVLEENIREYKQAIADPDEEEIPDLLNKEQYKKLAFRTFGEARGGDTIFPVLLNDLHQQLSDRIGIGDFQQQLKDVAEHYEREGLRPVLICEDVTTFNVLKEQLLDEIFELKTGQYDIVLGWTTGFERDGLDQAVATNQDTFTYMQERAKGYLSTTNDDGQAYFLTEDATVELARKYVSVIREKSDAVAETEIDEDAFDGLYPFNPAFVRRAYDNLYDAESGQERRTPRLLLIRVISECLQSYDPPFQSIEDNDYIKDEAPSLDMKHPDEVRYLYKWYGLPSASGQLRIPTGVFDAFDVDVPQQAERSDGYVLMGRSTPGRLDLRHDEGMIERGASITLQAVLSEHPEADVEIRRDGEFEGYTDSDGRLTVDLPRSEGTVRYTAEKEELSTSLAFEVGGDTLQLSSNPVSPTVGEEFVLNVKLNGEPVADATVYEDGDRIGTTGTDGTLTREAPQESTATYEAVVDDLSESVTVQFDRDREFPVETSMDPDEVSRQRVEFENWVKVGEEYPASKTFRDGVVSVLERWHEPTRLANPNATTDSAAGIYYTRGNSVGVSLLGTDERQGLSVELPSGTEYAEVYEPMFWAGISDDGSLPDETRYDVNYDLLRGWADDEVTSFRQKMRADIEDCLPDDMTIEQLIVLSQFLLFNVREGEDELSRDMVFGEPSTPSGYDFPVQKRFDSTDEFREAYGKFGKSGSVPRKLGRGFFLLKENLVDADRLDAAHEAVDRNLQSYLMKTMQIEPEELADAYRVCTSRTSNEHYELKSFLRRVRNYAQALNGLNPQDAASHVTETVETIKKWYDPDRSNKDLRDLFLRLYEAASEMDAGDIGDWSDYQSVREKIEDDAVALRFAAFRRDLEYFEDIEEKCGIELVAALHDFEESRSNLVEWELYETIDELVAAAEAVEVEGTDDFEEKVRKSDRLDTYVQRRRAIMDLAGGD